MDGAHQPTLCAQIAPPPIRRAAKNALQKHPNQKTGVPDMSRAARAVNCRRLLDLIKTLILLFLFGVIAPGVGFLIRHSKRFQRWNVALICFMTTGGILEASEWGLTLFPFEYRSHARGYHFYFIMVPTLILIFARLFKNWREFKLPSGYWLFYLFCASATFSIFVAEYPTYVIMAAVKTVECSVIGIAIFNFLRDDDDLRFMLHCLACTMAWQFVVVLKQKYVNHIYQVYGTFEHQNSLSTFTTMIGLVFLGAGLAPKAKYSNWFLWSYIFCAAIVESSLSRGSLAMFALGTIIVLLLSLIDRVTKRRVYAVISLSLVAAIGLALTMDTIVGRFHDYGNDESKLTRDYLNEAARAMVADHPLGVGWNNFGRMINQPYHYGDHIDAHQRQSGNPVDPLYQKGIVESLYYLIIAENGYQSIVIFVAFFSLFLYYNLRGAIQFRSDFVGGFSIGMFAGCGVIYIQRTLERVLTQPRNMFLWFLLLGAVAKIETWRRTEKAWQKHQADLPDQFERNELAALTQPMH
jgi:hypothetical protein